MTEQKKKRGRPKKIKSAEDAYKAMESEGLMTPEGVGKLKEYIGNIDFVKPVINEKLASYVPFPSDWDKMGKVDRLKWLTEHRK